ncbi:MAG TPA: hypothetical protein VII56_23445 [Rhizomicrobium sp.]
MRVLAASRGFFALQLLIFLLAWLVLVEILVRTLLMSPSHVRPDAGVGWMHPANESFLILTSDAGYQRGTTNSLALNDAEPGPKTRQRVLVVGDSYVEAFQLPRQDNFISLAARRMPRLQWINGGHSGLDPLTELAFLAQLEGPVRPDAVLLVINSEDENELKADRISVKSCGRHVCDYHAPPPPLQGAAGSPTARWLMGHSALVTFLARKYKDMLTAALANFVAPFRKDAAAPAVAAPGNGWRPYEDADVQDVLALIFRKFAAHHPVVVALVPSLAYGPDRRATAGDSLPFRLEVAGACAAARVRCVDLGAALANAYARSGQPPTGFEFNVPGRGHLNTLGHVAVADALADAFADFPERRP